MPLVDNRVPKAKGKLWTTADLDLRVEPREKPATVGLVKSTASRSRSPARASGGYAEVIVGGATRWVTADYLSKKKEPPEVDGPQRPALPGRLRHRERRSSRPP